METFRYMLRRGTARSYSVISNAFLLDTSGMREPQWRNDLYQTEI